MSLYSLVLGAIVLTSTAAVVPAPLPAAERLDNLGSPDAGLATLPSAEPLLPDPSVALDATVLSTTCLMPGRFPLPIPGGPWLRLALVVIWLGIDLIGRCFP
jgi:hypothetical protein